MLIMLFSPPAGLLSSSEDEAEGEASADENDQTDEHSNDQFPIPSLH